MMTDNNFVPRALKEDEEALVDTLIYLAGEQLDDIIMLTPEKLQKALNKTGAWKKHRMTSGEQLNMILKLSKEGIINMDRIISTEPLIKRPPFYEFDPNPVIIDMPKYIWLNNTDWAYEAFQQKEFLTTEQAYEKYGDTIFIKMAPDDIEKIEYYYKATHELKLSVDDKKTCLCLQIDEDKPIKFASLDASKNQYKILKYLYGTEGNEVTRDRDQLKKAGMNVGKNSLSTQTYSDNRTVQALAKHELLMRLSSDEITFIKTTKATLNQIHELKTDLKLI